MALFFAKVITAGIAYFTTPIYTRLLTTDEYGQVAVFLSWQQIFGIVAMFCLSYGVFNNGMVDHPDHRDEYSFSMLGLSAVITLLFFLVLFACYPLVAQWINLDRKLLLLMAATFFVQPGYDFWYSRQRYELKYKKTVFWTVICALISPIVAVVSIRVFQGNRVYARLFGAEMPLLLIHGGFCLYLLVRSHGKMDVSYWKAAFLFNLPLIPHYLSSNILHSSDRVMIARMVSETATAHYSVAYSVASAVTIVWSAANASLLPYTYEHCKTGDYASISKATQPLLTAFAGACVLLIMLAPEVVSLMAPSEYRNAIYVIPPIIGGVFLQVHYFIYANIVYYYKKPKYVMYASVLSAFVNVFLNWLFIPRFGFIAAGYTTLVSYLLQAAIDYYAMKKVVGEPVYNMRYLGGLTLLMVVVSIFSIAIYDFAVIRYILLAIMIGFGIFYRKKIWMAINIGK